MPQSPLRRLRPKAPRQHFTIYVSDGVFKALTKLEKKGYGINRSDIIEKAIAEYAESRGCYKAGVDHA